jgi:NhaP-type Na+/H+ or K+/H+ antiporter
LELDAHTIEYLLFPPLIFIAASEANFHVVKVMLPQIMVLAVGGALYQTFVAAALAQYVYPYEWTFDEAAVFGAIAVTLDPMAVGSVCLQMEEMGVKEYLPLTVDEESHFVEGVTYIIFSFYQSRVTGEGATFSSLASDFLYELAVGSIVGWLVGYLAIFITGLIYSDTPSEVIVSMVGAWGVFYIAAGCLEASGPQAVVVFGLFYAAYGKHSMSVQTRVGMKIFWQTFQMLASSVLYCYAGCLIYERVFTKNGNRNTGDGAADWEATDIGWAILMYILLMALRLSMYALFYPLFGQGSYLAKDGYGFSWADCLVASQCGIRGAVTLLFVLIIDTDNDFNSSVSDMMLLHIGVITLTTLCLNATTIRWSVFLLGLNRSSTASTLFFLRSMHELEEHTEHTIHKMKHEEWAQDVDWARVAEYTPILKQHLRHKMSLQMGKTALEAHAKANLTDDGHGKFPTRRAAEAAAAVHSQAPEEKGVVGEHDLVVEARHIFLNLLKHEYEQRIETHAIVAHASMNVLDESLKVAQDTIEHSTLSDWDYIFQIARLPAWRFTLSNYISCGGTMEVVCKHYLLHSQISFAVELATHFIQGHKAAQRQLPHSIGKVNNADDQHLKTAVEKVVAESAEEALRAQHFVDEIRQSFESVLTSVRTDHAIEILISELAEHTEHLGHAGKIEEKDEINILRGLDTLKAKLWRDSHKPVSIYAGSKTTLRDHPLLHSAGERVKQGVTDVVHETTYENDSVVINQNELSSRVFIVASGKCRVSTEAHGEVDLLFPGAVIGLHSGFARTPSPVMVTAVGRTVLHRLDCSDLHRIADDQSNVDAPSNTPGFMPSYVYPTGFQKTLLVQSAIDLIRNSQCYVAGRKMPVSLHHDLSTSGKVLLVSGGRQCSHKPSWNHEKCNTAVSAIFPWEPQGGRGRKFTRRFCAETEVADVIFWDVKGYLTSGSDAPPVVVPPHHAVVHFPHVAVAGTGDSAVLAINVQTPKKQYSNIKPEHKDMPGLRFRAAVLNGLVRSREEEAGLFVGSSASSSSPPTAQPLLPRAS